MGPQRRLGIYVGFESPSIIKYLEPLMGDIFTARFAACQFDELVFPESGGKKLNFHGMHHHYLIMTIALINVN